MILTITLILSFLVAINFLLLIFSCNKTTKKVENQKPRILRVQKPTPTLVSNQLPTGQFAATGS
jgi:flagellar basal body-associated protein FliL